MAFAFFREWASQIYEPVDDHVRVALHIRVFGKKGLGLLGTSRGCDGCRQLLFVRFHRSRFCPNSSSMFLFV